MNYEIIDFHTHPFTDTDTNICNHKDFFTMSVENTASYMKSLGITKICGSVICRNIDGVMTYTDEWEMISDSNKRALELQDIYGDFYVPGFHVYPGYVKESCDEIEKMSKRGVQLIGELVPYMHGWRDYSCKEFDEILDVAGQYHMIVSFHSGDNDAMDKMVQKHPNTIFVGGYEQHVS